MGWAQRKLVGTENITNDLLRTWTDSNLLQCHLLHHLCHHWNLVHHQRLAKSALKESTVLLLPDQSLFCDKKTIKKRGKRELPTKSFTDWSHKYSGWQNIEKMATEMQSHGYSFLLRKVTDVDLFAAEHTFIHRAITNSIANIKHLQDIINQKMQRQSKNKKWCWKHTFKHILK